MAKTTNTTKTTTNTKSRKTGKTSKPKTAGPAGGDASDGGTVLPNQTVWEDTVIIAFRDLQWHRWRESVTEAASDAERTALLATSPADLHKLDHDAESAFGDVLTSQGARYFLFEFKAVRGRHVREHGKGMFERLGHAVAKTEVAAQQDPRLAPTWEALKDLTRRCHFGVFGQIEALPEGASVTPPAPLTDLGTFMFQKAGQGSPSFPAGAVKLSLQADPYIEWVDLANRVLADALLNDKAAMQAKAADNRRTWTEKLAAKAQAGLEFVAEASTAAAKMLQKTAVALAVEADQAQMMVNRDERAAWISDGQAVIERLDITTVGPTTPLETLVWGAPGNPPSGVRQDELAVYLAWLLDLPGPGQPDQPDGGLPGNGIRINLVRVVNKQVVQWTLTGEQIRRSALHGRLRKILDALAARDTQSEASETAGPPSPTKTKYDSIGGTEKDPSNDPEDQA
ncbi:hypothetical protein [Burkholderia gladioli]|uniref:hypothetical protein n=1 Tax=Burkholderia gladioli TaxID=28095 RepID=UPI0019065A5D|nr:hypothetical protein [Burkholderia gladioli]MBJ9659137.1 hypothetical protein [Burkholderia gladioli]